MLDSFQKVRLEIRCIYIWMRNSQTMIFKKYLLLFFSILLTTVLFSQEKEMEKEVPFYSIPDAAESYTPASVAARMIEGLGFRYRWATENLTEHDLAYAPDSTARTSMQTMEHILGLSNTILNAVKNAPNTRSSSDEEPSWEEIRLQTLNNFQQASELLKADIDTDLNDHKIIFKRGDRTSEFPFWNLINGPISDALWHCGQVVSFRRASGNPMNPNVNVFRGTIRE